MALEARVQKIELRQDALENTVTDLVRIVGETHTEMREGFEEVGKQFKRVDEQFVQVNHRFDQQDKELKDIKGQISQRLPEN